MHSTLAAESMPTHAPPGTVRLGVVSFINTLPLIDGLEALEGVSLRHSVPSLLLDMLLNDEVDVALCSSIDYQRAAQPLVVLPAGLLGCEGPTLTVRLYSTVPMGELARVHCDTDSHTSVALLQILLRELHHVDPELVPYNAREHVAENKPVDWPAAMLLIGDKVVTDSPPAIRYPHQMDLGDAWVRLTGLPFVFALWLARRDADPAALRLAGRVLDRQRRHNRERIAGMIHRRAVPRRWPRDLASDYLTRHISHEWTDAMARGVERFFELAHSHSLIPQRRPLELASV